MSRLSRTAPLLLCLLAAAPLPAQAPGATQRAADLLAQKQYAAAQHLLEPLVAANPDDARAAYELGRAYVQLDRAEDGVRLLERAVRLDERSSEYHFWLGNAYGSAAEHAGILRQAVLARRTRIEFERAVALDPDNVDAREGLVEFYTVAPGILGGSREKARRQVAEIRRRNAYRGGLSAAYLEMGTRNAAGAAAACEGLVREYPDSVAPYLMLGTLAGRTGRYGQTLQLLDGYLRRHPDSWPALYQVGRLGAESGQRLDRAEAALRRYLQHIPAADEPSLAAAHWRLGMVLEKRGNRAQARVEYRTALRLDPKLRGARESLRALGG